MFKKFIIITAAAAAIITAGCSSTPSCINIVPPNVNLTGEKTVIERQIVGDYMELEKDAWTISSVKTAVAKKNLSGKMSGDPELFKYMKVREFHYDKIKEYKSEGALGEANTGYVQYMETKKYESSPAEKKILLTVIDEENRARKKIFDRLIFISKGSEPEKAEIDFFGKVFAEEQRGLASKDEWIQENSGKWGRKK
ncbi:MAG TPA: DUF1318 domain-containing protein [Spirochaetota bacterium]|nr:DUF1318 domain-containing protein [Spirochaetota bacterium]